MGPGARSRKPPSLAQSRPHVATAQSVLAPDLNGIAPRLTRLGSPVTLICRALNARSAEIRAFLSGRLASGRAQERHHELRE